MSTAAASHGSTPPATCRPPPGAACPQRLRGAACGALAACHLVAAHACEEEEAAEGDAFADVMGQVAVRYGRRFHEEFFKARAK